VVVADEGLAGEVLLMDIGVVDREEGVLPKDGEGEDEVDIDDPEDPGGVTPLLLPSPSVGDPTAVEFDERRVFRVFLGAGVEGGSSKATSNFFRTLTKISWISKQTIAKLVLMAHASDIIPGG
jgi:hypothetical protein